MPQSGKKDVASQRAQDKESKRARGALSCAECRRLKLKCDKTVPCSSCKRRGCSAICPNGSLITGQGTRFVLADTEKLHQKIAQMSDRIRLLEDALTILQSTVSSESHPLLDRDLLKIKSSIELHAAIQDAEGENLSKLEEADEQYIDAFGTLAIRDDGAATFYGRSAGSESLLIGEASTPDIPHPMGRDDEMSSPSWPTNPSSASKLTTGFPFSTGPSDMTYEDLVEQQVPEWDEAYRLSSLYLETAPWFFGAVTKRQLLEELLPNWYDGNVKKRIMRSPEFRYQPAESTTHGGPHELALLFMIFCFGALTDMTLPPAPDNPVCDKFYEITKMALSLEPILERPPSVSTVQTLALMGIYEGLKSGENSIEATWTLMGMASKLAQSVGLHRDCARWQLSPAEVQKRRALFWELFITDGWQSLATGRLATFSLPFVDCELPFDPDQTMADDGSVQPSFPYWKARFGAECVAAVVQGTLTSRAPKYSIILELDRKVRDMELPQYAQGAPPEGAGLSQTMSHFMPTNYRELTLLYIHRCFFVHAIASNPADPIKSQYAPSFLAGYRSACDLLASVREQFTRFPAQIARFWVLWTHAFSSAVMISSVVTHGSQCKVAPAALLELKAACDLFEHASSYGGRAVKFLPIVRRLQDKAQKVYYDTCNGIVPAIPNDIFKPSSANDDEMHIFSGKTRILATKNRSKASPRSPVPSNSSPDSRAPSDSPPQTFVTDIPSFSGVHPNLVQELNGFDSQIRSQIQNAYNADTAGFTHTLVGMRNVTAPLPHYNEHQRQPPQREMIYDHRGQEQRRLQEEQYQIQLHEEQYQMQLHEEARRFTEQRQAEAEAAAASEQQRLAAEREEQIRLEEEQRLMAQQQQVSRHASHQHYQYPDHHGHGHGHRQSFHSEYTAPTQMEYDTHSHSEVRGVPMATPYPSADPPSLSQGAPSHSTHHSASYPILQPSQYNLYDHPPHAAAAPPVRPSRPRHPDVYSVQQEPYQESRAYPQPETITPTTSSSSSSSLLHWQNQTVAPTAPTQQYDPPAPAQPSLYGMHPIQAPAHYTPDAAMRGIAAEDQGLQATWQSYMYKVGSPRHLFED